MRAVIFGGANSLDNYLARPDGGVDWLRWSDGAAAIMKEVWSSIDTVLMGRKTYDVARKNGSAGGDSRIATYVFSRTLPPGPHGGATVVGTDPAAFVREVKQQGGKDICLMGGGDLAKTLFEADLIDEVGFNIHPVLLGAGVPLFHPMGRQIDLELKECRPFTNGCVYVLYRVKPRA